MRSMAYSLTTCGPFSVYHAAFPITLIGNQIADLARVTFVPKRVAGGVPITPLCVCVVSGWGSGCGLASFLWRGRCCPVRRVGRRQGGGGSERTQWYGGASARRPGPELV